MAWLTNSNLILQDNVAGEEQNNLWAIARHKVGTKTIAVGARETQAAQGRADGNKAGHLVPAVTAESTVVALKFSQRLRVPAAEESESAGSNFGRSVPPLKSSFSPVPNLSSTNKRIDSIGVRSALKLAFASSRSFSIKNQYECPRQVIGRHESPPEKPILILVLKAIAI